jgi:Enoyl-(Acyl carrier protein) reductase
MLTAMRSAVEALAPALALELAPVRVTVVTPGLMDTPLLHTAYGADRDTIVSNRAAVLPGRPVGNADEVAQVILRLMTTAYVTGEVVHMDGAAASCLAARAHMRSVVGHSPTACWNCCACTIAQAVTSRPRPSHALDRASPLLTRGLLSALTPSRPPFPRLPTSPPATPHLTAPVRPSPRWPARAGRWPAPCRPGRTPSVCCARRSRGNRPRSLSPHGPLPHAGSPCG